MIILVAFGFADGDGGGQRQVAEKVFEVAGVLAGGIDADVELRLGMLLVQLLELCFEGLIAVMIFEDGAGFGGDLQIGAEKANGPEAVVEEV